MCLCRVRAGVESTLNLLLFVALLLVPGLACVVCTVTPVGRTRETAVEFVKFYGLEPFLDVFVTPEDTTQHKPDGEPITCALDRLGVCPVVLCVCHVTQA